MNWTATFSLTRRCGLSRKGADHTLAFPLQRGGPSKKECNAAAICWVQVWGHIPVDDEVCVDVVVAHFAVPDKRAFEVAATHAGGD